MVAPLSRLKADEHPYVRKSAVNTLRDISRFHKALVAAEVATGGRCDAHIADSYKYAAKFLPGINQNVDWQKATVQSGRSCHGEDLNRTRSHRASC